MSPGNYNGDAEYRESGDVEAASRNLGDAMLDGEGGKGFRSESNADDEGLGRIAQAMVLSSTSTNFLLFSSLMSAAAKKDAFITPPE